MRVLVTGATGFVGRYAVADLRDSGHEVVPLNRATADLCNGHAVREAVREINPEACLHLAGIAFVPLGWSQPDLVFRVNVGGTIHLLEAFRELAPHARIMVCTSAQLYGNEPRDRPIREDDSARPDTMYGVSKLTADSIALLYARRYGMHVMTARPCNHIGPGQSADFVLPAFAQQIRAIAAGTQPAQMKVGNLDSLREFADVRDVVRAYRMLLEKGHPGAGYNIATGKRYRIGDLLRELCVRAQVSPLIEVDPVRFRPTDAQPELDCTRLHKHTGWSPFYSMADTLADLLA